MSKNYLNRLQTLDHLIKRKSTGTPQQLAKRINVSERTIFELIRSMKERGAPISYSRKRSSYFYTVNGEFNIGFYEF